MNELGKKPAQYSEAFGDASRASRYFSPLFWSFASIACSIASYVMMLYLMDNGQSPVREPGQGYAIHRLVTISFLPFSIAGSTICIVALFLNARSHRWAWFSIILFFAFFFASSVWATIEEGNRQRPPW